MTAESTDRDYDRLCSLLKAVSLRHQLLGCIEFVVIFASGMLLLLLGSLALPGLSALSPYTIPAYLVGSIIFLACLLWRGLRAVRHRPSLQRTARGLERTFPVLRDDITNSILLFEQTKSDASASQPSVALIRAQLRKSSQKVATIKPSDVVHVRAGLRRLVLLVPLALTVAMVLVIDSPMVGRALALLSHPLSTLPGTTTTIALGQKSPVVVARGAQVMLRFMTSGAASDRLALSVWPEEGTPGRIRVEREHDNTFAYRMESAAVSFRYQATTARGDVSPIGTVRVVDPPDMASLKLTLSPPPYTRLPAVTQENGHITTLNGTLVSLEARATKEVVEGEIALNEQNRYPLTVDGQRLTGSLLVLQPGTYRIRLRDALGFENPDPVRYEIRVVPDKFPEADISHPTTDMEITGDETLPVTFTAHDDFGLTSMRLVYQLRGEERGITLKNGNGRRTLDPQTFKWDLSELALLPGEGVTFRIEVEDNDAISGPKKGSSRSITLSVKDERARASREEADSQRLADTLLGLLADQLEDKSKPEALTKSIETILDQVGKDIQKMADRPERFDLEALQRNLSSLKERITQEPKEKVTQELERLALLAEDIARATRMNEVEAMAREVRNRQRQLMDALREFKGPPTRQGLEKITAQLKKLEELLRSVMDALGKLATRLPDEFVNSQELSGLEFQDMFGDLAEMYRKLAEGDISGALEAAQRMLQNLQEMMAALGRAGTRAGASPSDRLEAEMSREASELDKILAEEREIYSDTDQISSAAARTAEAETEARLDAVRPAFERTVESLRRALTEEQTDMAAGIEQLFRSGRIGKLQDLLEQLAGQSRPSDGVDQPLRELRRLVEELQAKTGEITDEADRGRLSGLSDRQERLKERTEVFLERLEALAQLFPGMDTAVLKDIEDATGSMDKAAGILKKADAEGALPPEEDVIRRLSKSQQAMQQMSQQMAQQAGARMQAGSRWGYMLAYDPRPGWYYGPWMPMPTLPQPEVRFPREKGQTGIDREEFEPPSKDAYRVPQRFREKIMESMKQQVPRGYEKDVEHYFRGLAQ